MERLTDKERAIFENQYGEMVSQMLEQIARLSPIDETGHSEVGNSYKINYRIVDFEAVYQLRILMLEYLRIRDMQWVPQLMPRM